LVTTIASRRSGGIEYFFGADKSDSGSGKTEWRNLSCMCCANKDEELSVESGARIKSAGFSVDPDHGQAEARK
jgi:hypothetical protein